MTRVLNLTGKDVINAAYNDAKRPDGKPQKLGSQGLAPLQWRTGRDRPGL